MNRQKQHSAKNEFDERNMFITVSVFNNGEVLQCWQLLNTIFLNKKPFNSSTTHFTFWWEEFCYFFSGDEENQTHLSFYIFSFFQTIYEMSGKIFKNTVWKVSMQPFLKDRSFLFICPV